MTEHQTTVGIYSSDLERLRQHQVRISFAKTEEHKTKVWLTMPEVIRALINAAEAKAEAGE